MAKDNKKEEIMREALRLFSEKGFAAVSMRDLAEAAGIRASTIYYYYESKQALFQDMIGQADALTAGYRAGFLRALDRTEKVEREPFIQAGIRLITGYLHNEKIAPLIRMLESERFHDPAAEESWKRMLFTVPIDHETKVFEMLVARGAVRETDAAALAGEYHGIVMLGYFTGDHGRMAEALGAFYDRVFSREDEII